ncbi:MAG: CRISPR-associated protein Cas4 [Clostridiales bacterium]|nr:CRISPR-associated protein Cas4 [Clostridiales bacterium]
MISGIQHFSFCRRRWALIHLEEKWNENYLTVEGRVMHERVHNSDVVDYHNSIITYRDMAVKSAELGITGRCDAVEFVPCENGIELFGKPGQWSVRLVEYKHGNGNFKESDRLQLIAQVMCLEEMFCCDIDYAFVFYNQTHRRDKVQASAELREKLKSMLLEMYDYYNRGYTPRVKTGQKCRNCSLKDICIPQLPKRLTVEKYLENAYEDREA